MIKLIALFLILLSLTAFDFSGTKHTVIFYIPHQDDETLTFGTSIIYHLESGHNVQVALLTDGSETRVGKKLGLDKATLVEARNREFDLALLFLGVKPEHIHKMGYKDGSLSIEEAKTVMKKFARKYPTASHKTYSYTDWHSDHKNAGLALKELTEKNVLGNSSYFLRRGQSAKGLQIYKAKYKEEYYPYLLAASRAYNIKDESEGWYGIGWESVANSFKSMESNPVNYYHR